MMRGLIGLLIALALTLLVAPLASGAQPLRKIPRIGYLGETPGPHVDALRQGQQDLGYVEGQNLVIEYRSAEGQDERLPALTAELVGLPVAVLLNPTNPGTAPAWRVMEGAARALKLTVDPIEVRRADAFERALAAIAAAHADALYVFQDYLLFAHRSRLVDFAVQHRLPLISMYREWADAGGLLAYGASLREVFRRVAVLMDQLLKGAKPEDLPVDQVMRLDLVINLKTAEALGLTISPTLLFQATEVIR